MATPQNNPPWLTAMLAQMYPGGDYSAMAGFPNAIMPSNPWNKPMPGPNAGPGRIPEMQTPIQGVDPRFLLAPHGPSNLPTRSASGLPAGAPTTAPVPNPANVGGAPIPAPVRMNRTSNNPNFPTIQYGVPGTSRSGPNAPIYTAANWGGGQAPAMPKGALGANTPQGNPSATPGAPYNIGGIFSNLPNNIFDMFNQGSGPIGYGGAYSP